MSRNRQRQKSIGLLKQKIAEMADAGMFESSKAKTLGKLLKQLEHAKKVDDRKEVYRLVEEICRVILS